ncbi:MAG TPA: glutathione S-transferase family protein [Gammaproteobacteria bacterium]
MSLTVYYHPLASFCWKVNIALYENDTPFTGEIVNLSDKQASARFFDLWPVGKMPVLRDAKRERTVPETSIIIEYLDHYYPGPQRLLPQDEERCLDARLWDRFFDLYVQTPMQRIVADKMRPENEHDPRAVSEARAVLQMAYGMVERQLTARRWAIGDDFSIADCAAAPALFYASTLVPFTESHPRAAAYFERLTQRPSVRRVLDEARPYFEMYPVREGIPARFL